MTTMAPARRARAIDLKAYMMAGRDGRLDVGLAECVRDTIAAAALDSYALAGGGVETGGYLLGSPHDPLRIGYATGPPEGSQHGPDSFMFGVGAVTAARRYGGPSNTTLGSWHSHPLAGETEPSAQDVSSAVASAHRLGVWTTVIATPDPEVGYAVPVLTAYVTIAPPGRTAETHCARIEWTP